MGFEPLTSAVQSQIRNAVVVRCVQKVLQIEGFHSSILGVRLPLFVWVGVLLVYMSLTATPTP